MQRLRHEWNSLRSLSLLLRRENIASLFTSLFISPTPSLSPSFRSLQTRINPRIYWALFNESNMSCNPLSRAISDSIRLKMIPPLQNSTKRISKRAWIQNFEDDHVVNRVLFGERYRINCTRECGATANENEPRTGKQRDIWYSIFCSPSSKSRSN